MGGRQRLAGETVVRPRRPLSCLRAACGRRTVEDAAGMPVSLARPSPDLSAGGRRLSAAPSGTAQKSCQRTQLTRAGATSPLRAQARRLRLNHWCRDQLWSFRAPRPGAQEGGGGGRPPSLGSREPPGHSSALPQRRGRGQGCPHEEWGPAAGPVVQMGQGQSHPSCSDGRSVLTPHSYQSRLAGAAGPGAAGGTAAGPLRRPRPEVDTHV